MLRELLRPRRPEPDRTGEDHGRIGGDETAVVSDARIRLLALVDAGFVPEHARRVGPAYAVATGDAQWFQDNVPCQRACPAGTNVPGYIALIADGRTGDAYALNREANVLPACLGRVCARPCEDACRRQNVDAPVGICHLKRFAADTGRHAAPPLRRPEWTNGRAVAIVGAGPAGLAAAREFARMGYRVIVYERNQVPGGMLWAGIPEWRLPRAVIADEARAITGLGVEIRYGSEVDRARLAVLAEKHDAVLIAAGCQESQRLGIPGEDLAGVSGGLAFLNEINLGEAPDLDGQRVVVIGGGFTSIDCARSALRLGAARVVLAYRRSREEMPVDEGELGEAAAEGVEFAFMVSPVRVDGEEGRTAGVTFLRNRLGEPDASGRRRPEPVPGSELTVQCDRVIVAVGQRRSAEMDPAWLLPGSTRNGSREPAGAFRTSQPRIWAAGDYVTGPRNVISAVADGKRAARAIDRALQGGRPVERRFALTPVPVASRRLPRETASAGVPAWSYGTLNRRLRRGDDYLDVKRRPMPALPAPERGIGAGAPSPEVEQGYDGPAALSEAQRCLQCQMNIFIDEARCILCNGCVEVCPQQCIEMVSLERLATIDGDAEWAEAEREHRGRAAAAMVIDEEACVRCGRCVDRCPTGALTMEMFHSVTS